MKAFGVTNNRQDSFVEFDKAEELPTGKDLLVKIEGISVNPVDIATRKGINTELKEPKILGYDGYGVVEKIGEAVKNFQVGDKVFFAGDYTRDGSYQEYELIDERIVAHAPAQTSIEKSVAMPLVALTASELLFEKLNINPVIDNREKTILIINGAGGVGSIATQLAHLAGLKVIATASTPEKVKWVKDLGADLVVNHHQDLIKQVHDLGIENIDYIVGLSNNDPHWQEIVELIKPFGTFATITNLRESQIGDLKQKSVSFAWEWMFTKAKFKLDSMSDQGAYLEKLADGLDSGMIKSTVTKVFHGFNVENIKAATELVEEGHMMGKVVVLAK
ncbi:zinc-binding alcohol dehydrogenase family protein [Companilactobacillus bobalius]|uniref:Zinc-type alcohol dehydrogenase-like protein n=2 Tax=Companilactobacillus bobalius TaxID=2801451 RepID=A0A202F835_9LACO|nr:zinc-binding alcohol dehydrogenase family protein [Companilactobacillus bobalius]GEO58918.1 NADPH:quinone reductase [Companilactobacillus paralimentarius]KAE9559557.1 alcohol dehydrogenase [Companilactobacillus bobalius]KAE9564086.1 alcohol dehydrogenase [Companilactobacillus bobalius]KRK83571.1 quinone oxidoreductase [Companilactobacillus bobalius DSM 19674]OVE96654.1 NADPH:quinone reductase [Companilactobacillus bobalius]